MSSVQDASNRLQGTGVRNDYQRQLLAICGALIEADADEGISTDELMTVSGLTSEGYAAHSTTLSGLASPATTPS